MLPAGRRHSLIPKVDIAFLALEADTRCTFHSVRTCAKAEVSVGKFWTIDETTGQAEVNQLVRGQTCVVMV